jgi:hypothetical protein
MKKEWNCVQIQTFENLLFGILCHCTAHGALTVICSGNSSVVEGENPF